MRTLAILTLLTGFVAAVLLPNEVGTHDLPATGSKVITKAPNKRVEPPAGPVACLASTAVQGAIAVRRCDSAAWRSVRTASMVQLNLPLLI